MKYTFLFFLSIFFVYINAQENKKQIPIVYAEMFFGGGTVSKKNGGIYLGGELNFQHKKNLFSLRYLEFLQLKSGFFIIPLLDTENINKETAILYGKRWINEGHSKSISFGISYNNLKGYFKNENDQRVNFSDNYLGIPFEANIRLFNKTKKRHRIYMIFPVGKPTAFSRNIGFKLVGNISKNSYFGLGLS